MGLNAHLHLLGQSTDEDIARLAGVNVGAVRALREKRGIAAPRAPAAAGSGAASATQAAIHRIRAKVGRMPDREVAALIGVSAEDVKVYRRDHGIAAFLRPPPSSASAPPPKPTPAPVARASKPTGPVVVRRHTTGEGAPAETVTRPVAPPAPAVEVVLPAAPEAGPTSRLADYYDRLGKVPDQVIAAEAGVTRGAVGDYRRSLGIAGYDGFRFARGAPKPARPEGATARRSAIDDYRALLGTVRDAEIAEMAGVTRAAVAAYRNRASIAPYAPPLELVAVGSAGKRGRVPAPVAPDGVAPAAAAEVVAPVAVATPAVATPAVATPAVVTPAVAAPAEVVVRAEVAAAGVSAAPSRARSPRYGVSKLDAYRDIIGVLFDAEVARRAGMSQETVQQYRKRHGIPSAVAPKPVVEAAVVAVVASPSVVTVEPVGSPAVVTVEPAVVRVEPAVVAPVAQATVVQYTYVVTAECGGSLHRFVAFGANLVEAAAIATTALAVRPGGPWSITHIRQSVEALVVPAPAVEEPKPNVAGPAPRAYTGADMRTFRQERGLSQKQLAALLGGLNQSMISVAETSPRKPLRPAYQDALARAIEASRTNR